ncbi:MAG TPA: MBL fold metallo-hydrolase [Longimicrobium sp.]|nr:MBL fold metallo-hydrolase [Longimicrobium sp.]
MTPDRPAHHGPDGRFRIPWPLEIADARSGGSFLRWQWERMRQKLPPNPPPGAFPLVPSDIAQPRAAADELRITWIGHATFLVQLGGLNLLTDPVFAARASPLRWMGPRRFVPPGVALDALPPIDAVLLSHDHYDHLDSWSVRRLAERFGAGLRWISPLGYRAWLAKRGAETVTELDWWDATTLDGDAGGVTVTCAPAQHWTRRTTSPVNARLWGSFALRAQGGRAVYFGGDSGWFRGYRDIGERLGPFDAVVLPIGAYDPRWFMAPAHMNPEEAVRAYGGLGGRGAFVAMHWGTFRLTDEDPLEPPVRLRRAWADAGLPPEDARVLRHGETLRL